MTTALEAVPLGGEDQLYRIARQVRYDDERAAVHRVVSATFNRDLGYLYHSRCGEVLSAVAGALLTTRKVDCPGCWPGWKAGPS